MYAKILFVIVFMIVLMIVPSLGSAEDEGKTILPISLISSLNLTTLHEYDCGRNLQCRVRCVSQAAQTVSQPFDYSNVRRLELALGELYWAVGVVYVDQIGKGHVATGMLSQPVSCILDDLRLTATMPVVEGKVIRPSSQDEIIFDVQPLD